MKKLIAFALSVIGTAALAQVPTYTPNVNLMVPAYGQTNWQVPTNYNWSLIDKLLSGNLPLPAISVTGNANFPQLTSWQAPVSYSAGTVVAYLGTFYASLSNANVGNLPTNATYWTTSVSGTGITSLTLTVPAWLAVSGSPLTGPGTITISSNTASANTFLAAPNGSNGVLSPRLIVAADLPATAVTPGSYTNANITVTQDGRVTAAANGTSGSGGSAQIVYASEVSGATGGQAVAPGSSATGDTDSAAVLNAVLAAGNTNLVIDGGYALSASLVLYSGDSITCNSRANGVIMMVASNSTPIINAHQNAPTTASGTGGYLPSNITDKQLAVRNCTVNANSTQALTGTNSSSVAGGATPGGLFEYGIFFAGVNDVTIDNNDVYDSGAFNIFYTNATNVRISNNTLHQPLPLVMFKFTDAIHCIGPCQFVWLQNNKVTSDDDAIALNADDGNRTGSGDPNASYVQSFVKWGPILDFHIDNNTADGAARILRLYNATELIDRIDITNMNGTACGGQLATIAALTALGSGNIGSVKIDGWNVPTTNTCNNYGASYNFVLGTNFANLEIDHVNVYNPTVNWPVLTQTAGTGGNLSLHDWQVNSTTSTLSSFVALTGGSIARLSSSGITWDDAIGTGSVFSGTAPSVVACSDYNGPNLLLGSGFTPTISNGDCFTNTYPAAATTYVNTIFNEQSSGTLLAGTAPATCANGCTGTWTAASGGPASGQWAYSTNSATTTGLCTGGGTDVFCPVYINAGVANYTVRVNVTAVGSLGIVLRWTDDANFVTVLLNSSNATLYDVVSGTTTAIASLSGGGTTTGTYTVTIAGTAVSVTTPTGTFSGTITSHNTSNNVGINQNENTTTILSAFSVKSM